MANPTVEKIDEKTVTKVIYTSIVPEAQGMQG